MRLDEALQQLLNPKPEVQAEPGEEVEPDMTDLEEDIAAIEDVEDLEIVNQLTEEKKAEEASKERVVPSGMKELIPEPETEEELIEQAVEETSEDVPEDAVAIEAEEAEPEEPQTVTMKVNASSLNVRSEANTTSSVVTSLTNGDTVEVLGDASQVWVQIRCTSKNNEEGYVKSEYLVAAE